MHINIMHLFSILHLNSLNTKSSFDSVNDVLKYFFLRKIQSKNEEIRCNKNNNIMPLK